MKQLAISDFESKIGEVFAFSREWNGAMIGADLVLTKLVPYELDKRDRRFHDTTGKFRSMPFSLFFQGKHDRPMPQANYSVTQEGNPETLDIFITCRGPNDEGTEFIYEAIFG
ncbi:MAG: hypothetical protein Q8916_07355 [Bacteroidota bacterium]|nr:hypothetical protein [Bacteroidota bacterium]MDP4230208.1 hypothetical protein [Bacteroidota bacterium]MDP4237750.1 hypothetical protein [Bacteroidota bacterium]